MTDYNLGKVVGEDGRGIKDVAIEDSTLIITYDDDETEGIPIDFEINPEDFNLEGYIKVEDIVDTITDGDSSPVTSNAVYDAIQNLDPSDIDLDGYVQVSDIIDSVIDGDSSPVTSNAVYDAIQAIASVGVITDNELKSNSTNPVQNQVIKAALDNKVDKENGKGLSTNDYTTADKNLVAQVSNKVDKENGKGLSTNDYTTADKTTLQNIGVTYATKQELNDAVIDSSGGTIDLSGYVKTTDDIPTTKVKDVNAYSSIGSSANSTQATINGKIDSFIYGNGQSILAIETNLLELTGQLNDLETNLANFNDALLTFDGDTTTARDNLTKLKQNLQAILNKISDLQDDSSEFSSFLTQFQPKLQTLDITLSALYQGLNNFEGTLNDFEAELRSKGININQLDNGIVSLLELIFDSKQSIKAVEDDIGDANTPNTLWYHISQITTDLDDSVSGSLANLVKEAKATIGDANTQGTVLYDIDKILNTDIPALQNLIYGENGTEEEPAEGSLLQQIRYIQNTSLKNLRDSIAEAKLIADAAKDSATALNDYIGDINDSVENGKDTLWANINKANHGITVTNDTLTQLAGFCQWQNMNVISVVSSALEERPNTTLKLVEVYCNYNYNFTSSNLNRWVDLGIAVGYKPRKNTFIETDRNTTMAYINASSGHVYGYSTESGNAVPIVFHGLYHYEG